MSVKRKTIISDFFMSNNCQQEKSSKSSLLQHKKRDPSSLFCIKTKEETHYFLVPNKEVGQFRIVDGFIPDEMDSYDDRVILQKFFGFGIDSNYSTIIENHTNRFEANCEFCQNSGPLSQVDEGLILEHFLLGENIPSSPILQKYKKEKLFTMDSSEECITIELESKL